MAKIKIVDGIEYEVYISSININNVRDALSEDPSKVHTSLTFKTWLETTDLKGNKHPKAGSNEDFTVSYIMLNYLLKSKGKTFNGLTMDFVNVFEGAFDLKSEYGGSIEKHKEMLALFYAQENPETL